MFKYVGLSYQESAQVLIALDVRKDKLKEKELTEQEIDFMNELLLLNNNDRLIRRYRSEIKKRNN